MGIRFKKLCLNHEARFGCKHLFAYETSVSVMELRRKSGVTVHSKADIKHALLPEWTI